MSIVKRVLRTLAIFVFLLGLISLFLFTYVDRTPYQEMDYYTQTMDGFESIDKESLVSIGDTLKVGWARENLLPEGILPLAGYGARHGALYEGVHDSIWAKTFVFDNGDRKYAYVALDLLIVPMEVSKLLPKALDSLGFSMQNTFLTATHSHCSIGGWGTGIAGELFAGAHDPEVVRFIARAIALSVAAADQQKSAAKIGYSEIHAANTVRNRLVGDQKGTVDPWFRFMKIENIEGKTALLTTYSAHATCLHHSFREVSGDYPGELCRKLEASKNVDFAAFSAGAVGSMTPLIHDITGWPKVEYFANQLSEQVVAMENFIPVNYNSLLASLNMDIHLRDAQFRISENIRVRPWVFEQLFGGYPSQITSLRVGDVLFVGTPCDFSGELVDDLVKKARKFGLQLVITSFNGGYAGYITKDEWYDLDEYETRVMNWFGPYNGAYFSEVIGKIIEAHGQGG